MRRGVVWDRIPKVLLWGWGAAMGAFCVYNIYRAIFEGEAYVRRQGYVAYSDHPIAFTFSVLFSVIVAAACLIAFLSLVPRRKTPVVDQRSARPDVERPEFVSRITADDGQSKNR
jgi:predicted neutral ceramidase superfamily lipid hydrolase